MAGRSALDKLKQARELDKMSDDLKKRDPSASSALQDQANKKRKMALKQLRSKPKSKGARTARPSI